MDKWFRWFQIYPTIYIYYKFIINVSQLYYISSNFTIYVVVKYFVKIVYYLTNVYCLFYIAIIAEITRKSVVESGVQFPPAPMHWQDQLLDASHLFTNNNFLWFSSRKQLLQNLKETRSKYLLVLIVIMVIMVIKQNGSDGKYKAGYWYWIFPSNKRVYLAVKKNLIWWKDLFYVTSQSKLQFLKESMTV